MRVIELFENGQLKQQKLSKKRLMNAKPDFKQHHFQCLHNIEPSFQQGVLQKVVDREITLDEMKRRAYECRSLGYIQKAFMKYTNTTWDEAQARFPWHTQQGRLAQFSGLNFAKNVPDSFRTYCQSALRGENSQQSCCTYEQCAAYIHEKQLSELSWNLAAPCIVELV